MAFIVAFLVVIILMVFMYFIYNVILNKKKHEEPIFNRSLDKKDEKVKIENYGVVIFLNALFLSLVFATIVIEFPTYEPKIKKFLDDKIFLDEEIFDIPITEIPPPPPPVQIVAPEINEVEEELIEEEPPEIILEPEEIEEVEVEIFDEIEAPEEEVIEQILDLTDVQQPPVFPGGDAALLTFISNNFKWPPRDIAEGNEGRIFVSFVVGKSGKVEDVKILRGLNSRLDTEAIRVVKNLPKWSPGRNGGVPVKVRYQVPIRLKLD